MKTLYTFISIMAVVLFIGCSTSTPRPSPIHAPQVLVLKESNTVVIRGPIHEQMVTFIQMELMGKSATLPDNEPLYLVLDTPGGSVSAGMEIVGTALSLPREVKTVTIEANSMGFIIAQLLGERLILNNGHMMSHQPTLVVSGQIRAELPARLKARIEYIEAIEKTCSKRMGLPYSSYQRLIQNEWHVWGLDAVKMNAADRLIVATCDESLLLRVLKYKMQTQDGDRFIGLISACPVLRGIIGKEPWTD